MRVEKELKRLETGLISLKDTERQSIIWAGRLRGKSYEQIYNFLIENYYAQLPIDYSVNDVQKDLTIALEKLRPAYAETAQDMVKIEATRYDIMLDALWQKVTDGDTRAIDTALAISRERRKMLGLDEPEKFAVDWKVSLAQMVQSGEITPADIATEFGNEVLEEINYKLLEMK